MSDYFCSIYNDKKLLSSYDINITNITDRQFLRDTDIFNDYFITLKELRKRKLEKIKNK